MYIVRRSIRPPDQCMIDAARRGVAALAACLLASCGGGLSSSSAASNPTSAISVSPLSIPFGNQGIGTATGAQVVTLLSSGTAPLAIESISLAGTDAASFTQTNDCPATLVPNASCTVSVAFMPALTGAKLAMLAISTNATTTPSVGLSGTGAAAAAIAAPGSVNFGPTVTGTTSSSQAVTLTNTGTSPLTIESVSLSGSDAASFQESNTCQTIVQPQGTCQIGVTFAPSSAGDKTAILVFNSNASTNSTVALAGLATSPILPGSPVAVLKALLASQPGIAPYASATTSLATQASATDTTLSVTAAIGFPAGTFIAQLSDGSNLEYVLVTAGMGTSHWTVIRGYNGSPASAFAAAATVAWIPLAVQKSTTLNGPPLTAIQASFMTSVGGQSGGSLTSAIGNGSYNFLFSDGELRTVTVQSGTAVTWAPALASGSILTATTQLSLAPAGAPSTSPQLLTQRFDLNAPVYIAQHQRLAHRGAVLTADFLAAGSPTMQVDSTADFPSSGNFIVSTGNEDLSVNVADATTLNVIARALDGTSAAAILGAAASFNQVFQADFNGNGGTQAFFVPGGLNSGLHYLGIAGTVGPLKEYEPKLPLSMSFTFDGSYFELLTAGNVSLFVIADGVVQQSANYLTEAPYGGIYWHKYDFGSRKSRKITILSAAYPMSVAYPNTDTMQPWDRSQDPIISWDGDSFGGTEGYSWSSVPNGGGLGLYFELMLALGITQFDYTATVGGTGYSQEGSPSLPLYPRPKYSAVHRLAALTQGPPPTLFVSGLGHNDIYIPRSQFASDTAQYWNSIRAAWPETVLVGCQYFFPAAGPAAPLAFQPNPLSTANDPPMLAALRAAGGPWIYINTNQGTWQNSSGASGLFGQVGVPLLTGAGFGGAPGYSGGHSTGVGNGDLMIRDDGVHPSNLGAQLLGKSTAAAIIQAVAAL